MNSKKTIKYHRFLCLYVLKWVFSEKYIMHNLNKNWCLDKFGIKERHDVFLNIFLFYFRRYIKFNNNNNKKVEHISN